MWLLSQLMGWDWISVQLILLLATVILFLTPWKLIVLLVLSLRDLLRRIRRRFWTHTRS